MLRFAYAFRSYIFQKLCQRCVLFRRVQYISKDTNIYNDDKYVDELFYEYGNKEYGNKNSRESYPLEAGANVIVSCLYLSGYANYFAVDATRTPAAQQKIRMYEMKEGAVKRSENKEAFCLFAATIKKAAPTRLSMQLKF